MTDKHSGYLVTLEVSLREDDAAQTLNAIRQIKGVLTVDPVLANSSAEAIGAYRERAYIWQSLQAAMHGVRK